MNAGRWPKKGIERAREFRLGGVREADASPVRGSGGAWKPGEGTSPRLGEIVDEGPEPQKLGLSAGVRHATLKSCGHRPVPGLSVNEVHGWIQKMPNPGSIGLC